MGGHLNEKALPFVKLGGHFGELGPAVLLSILGERDTSDRFVCVPYDLDDNSQPLVILVVEYLWADIVNDQSLNGLGLLEEGRGSRRSRPPQ